MSKDQKISPLELLKCCLTDMPIETQIEELQKSFLDMLEYVMFLGLHDDYLVWEEDKVEYKKIKMLTNDFYKSWFKKNHNPEQEN